MRAVIFVNGTLNGHEAAKELLLSDDVIIAADGGTRHCRALGVTPSVVIGDLDSISNTELDSLSQTGAEVIWHDPRKDEIDLELALLHAKGLGVEEVLILGGMGLRWDQTFANLLLPAYEKLRGMNVTFWDDDHWLFLVGGERVIGGKVGNTLSLIPIGGDAEGVTTQGLEWALNDENLTFGATRGVSNVMVEETVVVSVRKGLLLCIVSDSYSGNQEKAIPDS